MSKTESKTQPQENLNQSVQDDKNTSTASIQVQDDVNTEHVGMLIKIMLGILVALAAIATIFVVLILFAKKKKKDEEAAFQGTEIELTIEVFDKDKNEDPEPYEEANLEQPILLIGSNFEDKWINASKVEMKVGNKKVPFQSTYTFDKTGTYKITYKFEDNFSNMDEMFSGALYIKKINFKKVDTSQVTSMSYMFEDCNSLEEVNVDQFKTENLTDASYMFYNCFSLKKADINSWNTEIVSTMQEMFANCQKLETVGLNKINTENVENMKGMFKQCTNLNSLDFSHFVFKKLEEVSYMFEGDENLVLTINQENSEILKAKDEEIFNEIKQVNYVD